MCGIHLFINGKERHNKADDFIGQAFTANMLRGTDSSGIVGIDADTGNFQVQKLPLPGMYFMQDKLAQSLVKKSGYKNHLTICHTRAGTQGGISQPNAHPFTAGDYDNQDGCTREIVGVHNGTLTNWKSKKNATKYDVDSEWAINHIFDNGIAAFEEFEGAFCMAWWDSDDWQTLNIARNDQRPFFVAFAKGGGMFGASEAGMLAWLAERNSIELDGPIRHLAAGVLYKFNTANPKEFTKTDLPKVKTYTSTAASSTGASNNWRNTTYVSSHVDAVAKVLGEISASAEAQAATPSTLKAADVVRGFHALSTEEVKIATEMGFRGQRGVFLPRYEDDVAHELYGSIMYDHMEMEAVMRNVERVTWNMQSMFDVSIIGVIDDGAVITAIVSHPKIELVQEPEQLGIYGLEEEAIGF